MRLNNADVLLAWPLSSNIITAGWTYNDGSLHRALDFRAAVGTPVYAAEGGTVAIAYHWNGKRTSGDTNSYGNMIKLKHATYKYGALETLYAHLSKLCVAQGQQVQEGQLIGYSGDTGNCYGAHLHFEVRWKGQRTNPLNWLDSDFTVKDAATGAHLGAYTSVTRPAPAPARHQHITLTCDDPEDAAQLGRLLGTLKVPLQAEVSDGDAYSIMRMAQTLGAEYKSEYVW